MGFAAVDRKRKKGYPVRILFICPKMQLYLSFGNMHPSGILNLATFLQHEGHEVQIYERNIDSKSLSQTMEAFQPDVVSCTLMFMQQIEDMKIVCRELRVSYPDIPILCGGMSVSIFPELILQEGLADYVGIGEGEYTFFELLEVVNGKRNPSTVQSLVYLDENGQPVHTPLRPFADLSDFPIPDFSLLPMEKYYAYYPEAPHSIHVIASKGCPFQCTFCFNAAYHRCKHRARRSELVLREIELLVSDCGADGIMFFDELWGTDKEELRAYCNGIAALSKKLKKPIRFFCETRFGVLSPEDLQLMADSGCWMIAFGLESGSPELLKHIQKNYPMDRVEVDIENCKKAGISVTLFTISGFPGETPAQIKQTIHSLFRLNPTLFTAGPFYVYPGSKEYDRLVEAGRITVPKNLDEWAQFGQERHFLEKNYSEIPDRDLKVIHYFFYWRVLFQNRKDKTTGRLDYIKLGVRRVLDFVGQKGFFQFFVKHFRLLLYAVWYAHAYPGIRKKYDLYARNFGKKDWDDLGHLDQK